MTIRIAVIADDLSGALDTVSPLAERGLRTVVFATVEALDPAGEGTTEVIGVSTNSRHLEPQAAAKLAAEATARLSQWKPQSVFKKIDSRLKGNIAEEASAIALVLGYSRLVIAPAAPDVGRLVINGQVTGNGVEAPLDIATRFAATDLDVDVIDATRDEQLDEIAALALAPRGTLVVCSRGVTRAVARLLGGHRTDRQFRPAEPILVVIGSRDPVTIRQVDALCEQGRFERQKAPTGGVDALAGLSPRLVLQCTGDQMEPGEVVAKRFAAGVAAVMGKSSPRCLLVSGGDTVSAVLRALGIGRIEVCGEVAPGLPWFMIPLQGEGTPVISKSGGFGDPQTLFKIFPVSPEAGKERMSIHGSQ